MSSYLFLYTGVNCVTTYHVCVSYSRSLCHTRRSLSVVYVEAENLCLPVLFIVGPNIVI